MVAVACALIKNEDGRYLLVQRSAEMSHPLKWEFPGGKLAPGETAAQAIQREIREELALEVEPVKQLNTVNWEYPEEKKIGLIPIICELRSTCLQLNEHLNYVWLNLKKMDTIDLLEADRAIINQLM